MNRRKIVWYIFVLISVYLVVLLGGQYEKRQKLQEGIAEKVLRFHVLANSDTREDQELKLKVRDAVGAQMEVLLADAKDRQECEQIVKEELEQIADIANCVIREQGYDYETEVFLKEVSFPVKRYGTYTFPAGRYQALEIVLGEGEGHNWWCVMYPNMCFAGSVYEVVDEEAAEALREVLSAEEYEEVLATGNYEVQFKYLTFLNELTE